MQQIVKDKTQELEELVSYPVLMPQNNTTALTDVREPKKEIESLDNIVDKAIEEVVNLEEGQEIYPKAEKPIEKQIPKEVKEQFEELEATIKKGVEDKKMISNTELYEMLLKLQVNIADVDKNVQDKKQEQIKLYTLIFDRLRFIKAHISKWFLGVLIIAFTTGNVVGITIYHNWENITPVIDKVTAIFKIANTASKLN